MGDRRRLTSAQRGIWFAQQLDPSSPAFVTADCIELDAGADPARLAAAVAAALAEAEGLHAVLGADAGGEPWQALAAPAPHVPVLAVDGAAGAEAWMLADRLRPIDLTCGALSRQAVLVLGDGRVWWYQAVHHLATDAYGTSLLLRRAAARYAEPAASLPPFAGLDVLDGLDAAYAGSTVEAEDRGWWAQKLAGVAGAPSLGSLAAAASPPAPPHRRDLTL